MIGARRIAALGAALATLGAAPAARAESGLPAARRFTTVERLADQQLGATHASGDDLRENVSRPAPLPGLTDYRAIFHAHASDSDHTGGTLDEILEDAHRARVEIVFLSDHPRPPRDFMRGWRGVREGVLFVPGAETESGYLLHPESSVLDRLDGAGRRAARAPRRRARGSRSCRISRITRRSRSTASPAPRSTTATPTPRTRRRRWRRWSQWMTEPDGVVRLRNAISRHPVEVYAAQQDYPADYLAAWDRATAAGARLVGDRGQRLPPQPGVRGEEDRRDVGATRHRRRQRRRDGDVHHRDAAGPRQDDGQPRPRRRAGAPRLRSLLGVDAVRQHARPRARTRRGGGARGGARRTRLREPRLDRRSDRLPLLPGRRRR